MRKSKFLQGSKDILHRSFKPDKCKTSLRMGASRLKLMRNKKEVQVKQLRKEIAQLLESGNDQSARIKVEHVVREEKMMAAYELVSLYSELVMTRMPIIESQKNCPIDLKEAVTSLIFASPRCSDILELVEVQKQLTAKYGKDFATAAVELRPDCGVSRLLVEKLSAKAPDGQTKLKILTAIAAEHNIEWDPKSFGDNDLTATSDLLKGPASFQAAAEHSQSPRYQPPQTPQNFQAPEVHAQSLRHEPSQVSQDQIHHQPLKHEQNDRYSQGTQNFNSTYSDGRQESSYSHHEVKHSGLPTERPTGGQSFSEDRNTFESHGYNRNMEFKDAASAAQAAAESAEMASMAARAAVEMANRDSMKRQHYTESQQSMPHSKSDYSNIAGEKLQKHSSDRYHSDRHRRSDSDQLRGVNLKNPGGTPERSNQGSYDRMDNYNRKSNLGSNNSAVDSSYGHSSPDAGKYSHSRRRSDSDQLQGVKFKNPGDTPERSNHGGYDRMENYNQRNNSRSNDAVVDDSYGHSSLDGDKYSQKSMYKEEAVKPQYNESEYRTDVHGSSDSEDFHHIEAVNSRKSMSKEVASKPDRFEKPQYSEPEYLSDVHEIANSRKFHDVQAVNPGKEYTTSHNLQPSIYDENSDASDSDHQSFKSHTGADSHFGIEKGRIRTDTSRTGSGNSGSAVFDEAGSDHEDISFDKGPKFDDQDSDSDSMSAAPSDIFRIPSEQDFGFRGRKLAEKPALQQSSSSGKKHSSHEFPVISETLGEDFKFDDQLSTKFDSDGPSSEGEDSIHESSHTSRKYLDTSPGSKGQVIPSPRSSFKEQGNQGVVEKSRLKSIPDESDDEILTQNSSELSSKLNYGNLTGGLRQKRYALPPYRTTQVDDASSPLRNSVEESSTKILESVSSVTTQSRGNAEVKQNSNRSKALSLSHDDSDTDSSEDERPAQGSGFGRERYTQPAVKDTEINSRSKVPVPYFESDSDEAPRRPKPTPADRNHMLTSGLSRRTKATPGRSPKVQPKHGETKSPAFSSRRKSAFSSHDSHSDDEPESQLTKGTPSSGTPKLKPKREESDDSDFSSDDSELNKEPEFVRTIATPNPGTPKVQPKHKGTNDSDFSSRRKSTFSSHVTEETESSRRNSGQSGNTEKSSSTRKTFEQIPESKVSSDQESMISTAAEQPDIFQQKEDAPGTTKTSQAPQSMGNAPSRLDSVKKPSHVHPKFPDYDIFQQKEDAPAPSHKSYANGTAILASQGLSPPGRENLLRPPSGKSVPAQPPPPVSAHSPPPPPPPPPIQVKTNASPAPPGKSAPPPPPPPGKTSASPAPPPPRGGPPPRPPPMGLNPPRDSPAGQGPSTSASIDEDGADGPRTKLKPFYWDKVQADPDDSMVWTQINAGSFRFNEETIESLFGYAASAEKTQNEMKKHSSNKDQDNKFIQIISQKKAHNFAILLKGLNVKVEEVCDALQEGNELPAELIETVVKMAPTAEEELKLRQYSGDISRLGNAERFLKALVDIPFAFKRLESLLFVYTFQEDKSMVKESFATLEAACTELRNSRLFLKLLEAVLKTGNRMNDGTFRGHAQAFKLDTLLKLSDVKGTDGKTTLLHFVVQEIIRSEGIRAIHATRNLSFSSVKSEDLVEDSKDDSEEHHREVGLEVVSKVGNDLQNVKKAAILNAEGLTGTVAKLGYRFRKAKDFLNLEMKTVDEENGFNQVLKIFVQDSEADIVWLLQEEKRIMALVKRTGDYFHGKTGKDEGLRIFIVVRDFLLILAKVCREVKNAPTKSFAIPKREDLTATPHQPPPDPRRPTLDPRQRLFPAIRERQMDNSSSDDDF